MMVSTRKLRSIFLIATLLLQACNGAKLAGGSLKHSTNSEEKSDDNIVKQEPLPGEPPSDPSTGNTDPLPPPGSPPPPQTPTNIPIVSSSCTQATSGQCQQGVPTSVRAFQMIEPWNCGTLLPEGCFRGGGSFSSVQCCQVVASNATNKITLSPIADKNAKFKMSPTSDFACPPDQIITNLYVYPIAGKSLELSGGVEEVSITPSALATMQGKGFSFDYPQGDIAPSLPFNGPFGITCSAFSANGKSAKRKIGSEKIITDKAPSTYSPATIACPANTFLVSVKVNRTADLQNKFDIPYSGDRWVRSLIKEMTCAEFVLQ